jgi:ABC-type branched-subunit amino acid transport system ATPase component/ABC-type branched-subunit amino acid transport system permease subunit
VLGLLVLCAFGPEGLPVGIAGLGVVTGCVLGLHAMGIVLLYSRTRVLSFAQFGLGALASVLFYAWVFYNQWAVLANGVCRGCIGPPGRSMSYLQHHPDTFRDYLDAHHFWVLVLNVVISTAIALWIARGQAGQVFTTIAGVFARAPRIVPTVATLAIAVMLSQAAGILSFRTAKVFGHRIFSWFPYGVRKGTGIDGKPPLPEGRFVVPLRDAWEFTLSGGARFHFYEIASAAIAIGMFVYVTLRFTRGRRGLMSRATASNLESAAVLGVDVVAETRDPWRVAGVLSGLAGVLAVAQAQATPAIGLDFSALTLVLAAVVLARLVSPGWALVASIALGVLAQGMFWNFHSQVQFQASLVVLIGVALLIQRRQSSRASRDAESVFTSAAEPLPVPAELRNAPGVHGLLRGASTLAVLAFLTYPLLTSPRQLSLGIVAIAYMVIGLSLLVLSGWAGQVSLGQFAFAAVGAYVAAVSAASWHVPLPFSLVLGALVAGAVAPIVGLPALRLPGPFVAIMTLAFALAVPAVLLSDRLLGSALPNTLERPVVLGLDFSSDRFFYWFALLVLLGGLAITMGLRRSRLRRALIAARDNELAAAAFGLDVTRVRLEAFAVAGVLAGLGGGLLAYANSGVQPDSFSTPASVVLFLVVVIGGLSAVSGPVLGASLYALVQTAAPGLLVFLNGFGTVLVLATRPSGIAGIVSGLRDAAVRVIMHLQGNDLLRFRTADGVARIPVNDRGAQAPVVPVRYRIVGDGYAPVEGTRLRPVEGAVTPAIDVAPAEAGVEDATTGAALACHRVEVAYGGTVAVQGVSLQVAPGEVLAVVGLNGAGKTSLLRALAGLEPLAHGTVHVFDDDVTWWLPQGRAALGVAFVAGGGAVLPTLSVAENLAVAGDDAESVLDRFPILRARLDTAAGNLSGGEQHVLAIAQALLRNPRVLLIDELSLGLSPEALDAVLTAIAELTARGAAVVIVEQSISHAMDVADTALFLESGRVRYQGPAKALRDHPELFASVAFGAGAGTSVAGAGSELARAAARETREPVLQVQGATAAYGPVRVVDDVSFEVTAGEVIGVLGPNGAGKTSLFDCLSGILPMSDGAVVLQGRDVTALRPHQRAELGLMRSFQSVRLFPSLTVRDCIAVALETRLTTKNPAAAALWLPPARTQERRVDERVDALLELLRLEGVADSAVGSLSLGARRMVDLACQLAARPKVLLLDEPASGLAHSETELLGPLITRISADLDCAVLIIEHNVAVLASVAHRLVAMRDGAVIADGAPTDVLADEAVRAAYFGTTTKELVTA